MYHLLFFWRISTRYPERVLQSILYLAQLVLGYMLMLIAMTFNIYLFLAIIFGIGTGHLLYTWSRLIPSTRTWEKNVLFIMAIHHSLTQPIDAIYRLHTFNFINIRETNGRTIFIDSRIKLFCELYKIRIIIYNTNERKDISLYHSKIRRLFCYIYFSNIDGQSLIDLTLNIEVCRARNKDKRATPWNLSISKMKFFYPAYLHCHLSSNKIQKRFITMYNHFTNGWLTTFYISHQNLI
jgi:hypothetical protein